MPLYANYNPNTTGVHVQAHPNVFSYPWIPQRITARPSGVRVGWTERVNPNERGRSWGRSSLSIGATMGGASNGCGCGGK